MHYENQFDVAAGTYTLKVVFGTSQDDFGKLEAPLLINAYETKDFALSGIAISTAYGPVSATDQNLDSMLLEGRSPLVAATPQGVFRFTPTGIAQFKATDKPAIYFELYDPLLTAGKEKKPNIAVQIRVLDAKSQAVKSDTGNLLLDSLVQIGSPVVPTGLRIPVSNSKPSIQRVASRSARRISRSCSRGILGSVPAGRSPRSLTLAAAEETSPPASLRGAARGK